MDIDPAVLRQLALGAVPPGIVATLGFALLWWRRRGRVNPPALPPLLHRLATPCFFAAFYTAAHALLFGGLNVPPRQSTDWLPLFAALGAALAMVGALWRIPSPGAKRWLHIAAQGSLALVALAAMGYLGAGRAVSNWSSRDAALHILPFALLCLVAIISAEILTRRRGGAAPAIALLITCAGAAQVLMLAFSSLKLGQSAGLAAAFFGGAMLIAFFRPRLSLAAGAAIAPLVLTFAALYHGALFTYTSRPWMYIGCIAAAPVLAALASWPGTPWSQRLWVRALPPLAALLPVVAALVLALSQQSEDYDYSKRRGRDSNPRYGYPYTRFPVAFLRPLGHLSGVCRAPVETGDRWGIASLDAFPSSGRAHHFLASGR
jgi:hypothetical protein